MNMRSFLLTAGLALASSAATAQSQSYEIRYEGTYGNGQQITSNYGSIAGVIDVLNITPGGSRLTFWADSYSGRPAAYSGDGSIGLITLTPAAGLTVTLDSFFLGGWPNTNRNISYSIDDLATPELDISVNAAFVSGATGLFVTPALTSAAGLRISFGPDGYNGGINNIAFSVTAVPEPESSMMLLAGLGLVGAIARHSARSRAAT